MLKITTIVYGLATSTFISWGISILTNGFRNQNEDKMYDLSIQIIAADGKAEDETIKYHLDNIYEEILLINECNRNVCCPIKLWHIHRDLKNLEANLCCITKEIRGFNEQLILVITTISP